MADDRQTLQLGTLEVHRLGFGTGGSTTFEDDVRTGQLPSALCSGALVGPR
jgi:hypothetical protein